MGLDRYLRCEAEWIDGTAKDADIVISTRIRLARNFAGIHFGDRATPKMKGRVLEYGQDLLERSQRFRGESSIASALSHRPNACSSSNATWSARPTRTLPDTWD